jgi:hypothetical protein
MKSFFKYFFGFFSLVWTLGILSIVYDRFQIKLKNIDHDETIESHLDDIYLKPNPALNLDPAKLTQKRGFIQLTSNLKEVSENTLLDYFKNETKIQKSSSMYLWSFYHDKNVNASAFGLDFEHHFVNSYLIGFEPFKTDELWVPLSLIAKKLKYEYDHKQYFGLEDVWQNSKQAFYNNMGDCEDHSLVLADWLISMGEDAKVVIGKYKDQAHAWVILNKNNKTYLLEATSKIRKTNWQHYPLAKYETNYKPKYMFNRKYFWYNTGSQFTTNYTDHKWIKKSVYFSGES